MDELEEKRLKLSIEEHRERRKAETAKTIFYTVLTIAFCIAIYLGVINF